jgi:cytochrome c oxidase subunit 2
VDHQNRKSAVVATRPGRRLLGVIATLGLLLAACSGSGPQTALNPAGPEARTIDNLWELVFVLAAIVFVIVESALFYTIFRWRARKGDDTEPVQVHGNTRLEIVWTIIPVVLLAFVAVPMVKGVFDVRAIAKGDNVLQVQVTGHQWWWEFEYMNPPGGNGQTIVTANELVIPEDTEVNLTMTSADVIHSFWVPTLNGKRDVVPNRITNLTLIADDPTPPDQPHPGQCAEYCGLAHADMRFKVRRRYRPCSNHRGRRGDLPRLARSQPHTLRLAHHVRRRGPLQHHRPPRPVARRPGGGQANAPRPQRPPERAHLGHAQLQLVV